MSLRFHYIDPAHLLNKLEREAYRTFHAGASLNKVEMCDHFFNFCVTAHALRDWVSKSSNFPKGIDIHEVCNEFPELKACRDIANSNKHFNFEPRKETKGAVVSHSEVVDVFEGENGEVHISDLRKSITISVVIEGEPIRDAHEFTKRVIGIWVSLLKQYSIPFQSIYKEEKA